MSFSGLSIQDHFEFGKLLKKEIINCRKKIAVISSGDLSHRLTRNAPAGYSSKGKKFDKKIWMKACWKKLRNVVFDPLLSFWGLCITLNISQNYYLMNFLSELVIWLWILNYNKNKNKKT